MIGGRGFGGGRAGMVGEDGKKRLHGGDEGGMFFNTAGGNCAPPNGTGAVKDNVAN